MVKSSRRTGALIISLFGAAAIVGAGVILRRWKNLPLATKRISLLNVPIDPMTMEQALERINEFIRSGEPHHIVTADASGIMRAQEDAKLLDIVRQADLVTPDGAGVMLASKMSGTALPERVSGVDLVEHISALAAAKGYSIYLFGAAEGIAQAAAECLQERHPGLTIAGVRNGYFSDSEEKAIVQQVAAVKPEVLFVALGIPKQEIFINKHFCELGVPVMIGIGGSFDVISGKLNRAPVWMQKTGFEWLYRVMQEPKRLPRLAALPHFILAAWRGRKQSSS